MTDEDMKALGSRRDFFKKMVALGFAIPVISSFSLEGVAAADGTLGFAFPNQRNPYFRSGNQRNPYLRYGNGGYDDDDK
jgi:hypothetical protein